MLKAADSLLLPTPEPGKAKLAAVGREGGVQRDTDYHHAEATGAKSSLPERAVTFPRFLITQETRQQPAQVFFRALPQLGGRSRQALALLPWASKFNSARPTKKKPELAVLKHRSGSSLGSFENSIATIMATTN